jgi:hypothetical protein
LRQALSSGGIAANAVALVNGTFCRKKPLHFQPIILMAE